MKFALVDGFRRVPEPGLYGKCPIFGHPMVAKCGQIRTHHWAHQGSPSCDRWWENETEWHRAWKGHFPEEWQEVIHETEQGEKHIADVKTDRGWAIEFQHSPIKPEERHSREVFYKQLIWVVDGLRRKRDLTQFFAVLNSGTPVGPLVRLVFPDECALLREWSGSTSLVFIDFGESSRIWWLLNKGAGKPAYALPFPRAQFVGSHRGQTNEFEGLAKQFEVLVTEYELHLTRLRSAPLPQFQNNQAYRNSRRRRL